MELGSDGMPEFDAGEAGASARREHERRRANRERRVQERHPRIGKVLLALADTPQHEKSWENGAAGEERVAEVLANRCGDSVLVLHDRRIPRSRANIDHIAVAPSGVWVVDSKRYNGAKVAVSKPLFGQPKLLIAGREKTKLVDGLDKQVALVRAAVEQIDPGVPVRGAFCFVGAELPVLRTLTIRDHPLLYPRSLAKRLNAVGELSDQRLRVLVAALATAFPAA